MRDDLVGEYVGQTAPKTHRVLDRAMGSVLLHRRGVLPVPSRRTPRTTARKAVDIYAAGDGAASGTSSWSSSPGTRTGWIIFFGFCNPGMSSRIAHHLDFADYDARRTGRHTAARCWTRARPTYLSYRRRIRLPRSTSSLPDAPAPVRQRPQCPQRTRTSPPLPRTPPRLRPAPHLDPRRPHAHRAHGHPRPNPTTRGRNLTNSDLRRGCPDRPGRPGATTRSMGGSPGERRTRRGTGCR